MACAGSTATRSSPPRSQLRAGSPISLLFLATVLLFCAGMLFVMAVIVGLFWCLMAVYDTLIVGLLWPSSTPRGQSVGARDGKKPAVAPPKSHSLVGRSSRESVVPTKSRCGLRSFAAKELVLGAYFRRR